MKCVDPTAGLAIGTEAGFWRENLMHGYLFKLMHGYLDDANATHETIDADSWLHTGAIGVLNKDR